MKKIESIKEFGGFLNRYSHQSLVCNTTMNFSVYLPSQSQFKRVPAVYWLSGLTCTDDNARIKAGAQRYASELGLALIFPDTSPRGENIPDVKERYDIGIGAGFYVNSTQIPWSKNYQMYSYIIHELPLLVEENFPILKSKKSITGQSMGGHGALICALKNPQLYSSVSAFAPICNPINSSWGKTCFSAYLGENETYWVEYDATNLVLNGKRVENILIDQGLSDEFYEQKQLLPENFIEACKKENQSLNIRFHEGYDHSYHFVATFIGEHLSYHASFLK